MTRAQYHQNAVAEDLGGPRIDSDIALALAPPCQFVAVDGHAGHVTPGIIENMHAAATAKDNDRIPDGVAVKISG